MPGFAIFATHWWIPVVFVLIAGHLTNVCVTLFLHRAQTHRSVTFHSAAAVPMRIWLWLSTSIVTKEWVACHRKHHAFADREGDPHSPLLEGLRNIVVKGAFYYRKAIRQQTEPLETFRRYLTTYAFEQAFCHLSDQLIVNLEKHWNARQR